MKRFLFALFGVLIMVLDVRIVQAQLLEFDIPPLVFTPEEQEWIKNNKVLGIAVEKDAPPYEYLKGDEFLGIASSYIRIIEQSTGVRFEIKPVDDLPEAIDLLEEGEVSVVSMAIENLPHPDNVVFTFPYVASSLGIFGNSNSAFINNFDDVLQQKVAISRNTLDKMPRLVDKSHNFEVFDDVIEAMREVNKGNVAFYVGDLLHTKFSMDVYDFNNLRYIAPVVGSAYSLSMAVKKDDVMLLQIIDKTMKSINPIQHFEIRQKWTSDYYGREILLVDRYLRYLYISFALFAVILGLLFYRIKVNKKKALQIAYTQKMESIGQLAGGVAHDFNNMLAGIHGAAEILEMKLGEENKYKKYTDIIINACERSSYLTSQLLVFSRDKGQNFADMNLHECLNDAVALLEHGINKKIIIGSDFKAEDYYISGNRNLIQSLILNLGFNAKDAMCGKGEIDISTRNVVLDEEYISDCLISVKPQEYIEIVVRDYGCGIPDNIRHKIFDPFFTTKEIGKGTGLGLAAVYGIVLEHKGTIKIETSDKGTSFYIYFPVIENKILAKYEHKNAQSLKAKVLVVDDEKILLELMKDILTTLGAEVIVVNDSTEAVEVYKQNSGIDIVMLDVIMPKKTGVEVYEDLLKLNPEINVIFMSGYNKDNEVLGLVEKNANVAFINKPYTVVDCQEKISSMLAKK